MTKYGCRKKTYHAMGKTGCDSCEGNGCDSCKPWDLDDKTSFAVYHGMMVGVDYAMCAIRNRITLVRVTCKADPEDWPRYFFALGPGETFLRVFVEVAKSRQVHIDDLVMTWVLKSGHTIKINSRETPIMLALPYVKVLELEVSYPDAKKNQEKTEMEAQEKKRKIIENEQEQAKAKFLKEEGI